MNFTSSPIDDSETRKTKKKVSAGRGYTILQTKLCWQNIQDIISLFVMSNPLHRREKRWGTRLLLLHETRDDNHVFFARKTFFYRIHENLIMIKVGKNLLESKKLIN